MRRVATALADDRLPAMNHPLEAIIREAYAAFGRGDVDGYLRACTEEFEFHVPGVGGISGTYIGKDGLYALAEKAMTITGSTFREIVEDVLANDLHAVVLARHRFTRDGAPRSYRTAHVYEIRDGKLARCFEQPRDQAAFDEAWGPHQAFTMPQGA
jgi:ketosteroid isomerase-like protein